MADLLTIGELLDANPDAPELSSMSNPALDSVMTIGPSPFPMLYLYYKGLFSDSSGSVSRSNRSRVSDSAINDMRAQTVTQLTKSLTALGQSGDTLKMNVDGIMADLDTTSDVMYTAMCSAIEKNRQFKLMLVACCQTYVAGFERNAPSTAYNAAYYTTQTTKNGKRTTTGSQYPIVNANSSDALFQCMEVLRIAYDSGIITADTSFDVRPINITTGAFIEDENSLLEAGMSKILGLPARGLFSLNPRGAAPMLYRTFNGTNLELTASIGSTVTELTGMTAISWSIHREKQSQRTLGKTGPSGRTRGGRTVAGTMVFNVTDHHPLLDLFSGTLPNEKGSKQMTKTSYNSQILSDELPAFDLIGLMYNEYGNASMIALYGVEVMDEGCVLSVDNVITEMTFQYTAQAMDPIVQVSADENGQFDFLGVFNSEYMNFWRRREEAASGVLNSDLESEADAYYKSMFSS